VGVVNRKMCTFVKSCSLVLMDVSHKTDFYAVCAAVQRSVCCVT